MFGIKTSKQYRENTSRKIAWGHWFAFFNILWAIVIGARYAFLIDWPDTLFGKLYFFISLLGHFSFIVFALYLLIIFPLSFMVKNNRTFRGLSVILTTIGATLLLVDTEVFARFNFHLSSLVWNLLVNPDNGELSRNWQLFFVPMPIILLIQMLFSRWSWEKLRSLERQKWLKGVGVFFVCTFIATHLIYAWADAFIYRPITMQKSNFPLSYPMTARSFLEKHGFLDKNQYSQTLEQEGRPEALKIDYPKSPLRFTPVNPSNILIITVSGLRYDAISAEKMPQLSAFAEQATQYLNHYSTGNNNNTALTGLFYGLTANYTDSLLSNKTPSVLISTLKQEKFAYQLGLFSSDGFHASLLSQNLFNQQKLDHNVHSNRTSVQQWHNWYAKHNTEKPYFSYLSLTIPQGLNETAYALQLNELDGLLDGVLREVNRHDTLILITAEEGYHFTPLSEKQQSHYFAPEEIHVPLIIAWQGLEQGQVKKLTSHTDILPTLMTHLFGVQNPASDYAQGMDLFNPALRRSWVQAGNYRWNVIVTADGTQYHLDRRGNYQEYDRTYQKTTSRTPPLGLFLEVFNQDNAFFEK
ncbi:DUF3413 domain-containing protein [Avibacterium sp. 20-129]|uniref:DUF3413 domain-containing protein n=1 Tax=Avibacterium sp. 20-129 TaxID=2911525 RepID=UPI00224690DF|nr:DUF3413 domain-containing protein [Avibacterium sp. 20-129]MCW9698976.1 DUF3413 domain-containing protein [Avibacterium sp. 20-129]